MVQDCAGDSADGGFGGGGGSGEVSGGAGGGYIEGIVPSYNRQDSDRDNIVKQYSFCGALSYDLCKDESKVMVSGFNEGDGKIELEFIGSKS